MLGSFTFLIIFFGSGENSVTAILQHLTNLHSLAFGNTQSGNLLSPTLLDGITCLSSLQSLVFNISVSMQLHVCACVFGFVYLCEFSVFVGMWQYCSA